MPADTSVVTTSWQVSSDASRVVIEGLVEEPADGEGPTPFRADFSPVMLPGIAKYLDDYRPWGLWVGADGEFRRDHGWCSVEALQFGWSTWDGLKVVQLVATVRHERLNDATANEPQVLLTFDGNALPCLRADLARLWAAPPR